MALSACAALGTWSSVPAAIFAPVTAPLASFAVVTEPSASSSLLTAAVLICFEPTEFFFTPAA